MGRLSVEAREGGAVSIAAPHETQRETLGEFLYPHAGQTIGFAVAFDMTLSEG
jgi:hypothetical protein